MNEPRTQKRVAELEQGDRLVGSGAVVVRRPYVTARSPRGKMYLVVRRPNGDESVVQWGRNTRVTVERTGA